MQQQTWFVYILECADSTLYTGVTTDPERRLAEHNGEKSGGARYTRNRRPVSMIHREKFDNRSSACKREYDIKQMSAAQKRHLIRT